MNKKRKSCHISESNLMIMSFANSFCIFLALLMLLGGGLFISEGKSEGTFLLLAGFFMLILYVFGEDSIKKKKQQLQKEEKENAQRKIDSLYAEIAQLREQIEDDEQIKKANKLALIGKKAKLRKQAEKEIKKLEYSIYQKYEEIRELNDGIQEAEDNDNRISTTVNNEEDDYEEDDYEDYDDDANDESDSVPDNGGTGLGFLIGLGLAGFVAYSNRKREEKEGKEFLILLLIMVVCLLCLAKDYVWSYIRDLYYSVLHYFS
ncbi:coiled-coil domain-containing protein [Butyrivibrio sp. FCS014]|uniref:coiled-coil domain-containing protein n=1 Tax=Butyrivibrio sp. FCS014 TaxID=1408304 RepID=UPI0004646BD3|nr:hypothetical protein [Butyrivibrio sp. FCS014]